MEYESDPQRRLQAALGEQRDYLTAYEQPSEVVTYETLQALDDLFFRDFMEPKRQVEKNDHLFRSLSTWGVNQALRRVIPKSSEIKKFKDFPSHEKSQAQAEDFIFNCAALGLGERYEGWLRDGIVSGEVRRHTKPGDPTVFEVLILRSALSSYADEEIGMAGLHWSSGIAWANDRGNERHLERRYRKLTRDLERRVFLIDGWKVHYTSTPELDSYFMEWARLYLRRMYSQEMIAPDDMVGGRPFSRYIEVLSALSARSQKHIAYAAILRARHEEAHLRNLLTSYAERETFINSLARSMDADRSEIESILLSLTLSAENLGVHTRSSDPTWAPIVQASAETFLLPNYGLDMNPFLFLLTDLRARYEKDWFRVANNREGRWIDEIKGLFEGPRWQTHDRNLKLRSDGRIETDIDFAVLDRKTGDLALFQLKWQQPIGSDNRARRSAGKNLIEESNRWIQTVSSWLDRYGVEEMRSRLGFDGIVGSVHLFVLGRYHAHFTGFDNQDQRAVWSDWAHFKRMRIHRTRRSISQLASDLRSAVDQSRVKKEGQSLMLPIGDLSVILNPTSVPDV